MKQKQLSFYVTISDITIRLKQVSLRTISHVAAQLADLENVDDLQIMVTSVTQHSDYQSEDEDVFMTIVKKSLDYKAARKNEPLPIDLAITTIREAFPKAYIKRDSNAMLALRFQFNSLRKYRVFAGLLDEIVLHVETSSQPDIIRFDSIDELIKHVKLRELQTSRIKENQLCQHLL